MNRRILLLSAAMLFVASALSAETKVAPYYSLRLVEGASVPSFGDWQFALNLESDLGLIVQPSEKHRFVGFYEIKYNGPGLRRQEGEKFTDRTMDHIIITRHHYLLAEGLRLKSQLDYMTEFKRTGSNEIWGKGLYDFDRYGGGVTLEKEISPVFSVSASQQYHYLAFPNYTDLLAEAQVSGGLVESSTGKQNHGLHQTVFGARYGASRLSLGLTFMLYEKQKVITDVAQPDQTYYSSTLQRDAVYSLQLEHERKISAGIAAIPSMTLKLKNSNQNYQHFATATSSEPVRYIDRYYDYQQFIFAVPFSVPMSSRWQFFFQPEWDMRVYLNRPPRDENNNFLTGVQVNDLLIVNLGFHYTPNAVARTTLFYTYQQQSSNMKFEKYLPYNYAGHYFGLAFSYTY